MRSLRRQAAEAAAPDSQGAPVTDGPLETAQQLSGTVKQPVKAAVAPGASTATLKITVLVPGRSVATVTLLKG